MNKMMTAREVLDSTEKLANMSLGPQRQYVGKPRPPPMKAGVQWFSGSGDMFLKPANQEFQPPSTYTRKVAG